MDMIGLKVAVTGAVLFALSGSCMAAVGKKMPSLWIALPLLFAFFGGLLAMVGGFLHWVWF
jgi:hypothetical protein